MDEFLKMMGLLGVAAKTMGSTAKNIAKPLIIGGLAIPPVLGFSLGLGSRLYQGADNDDKIDLERAKTRAKIRALQDAATEIESLKEVGL